MVARALLMLVSLCAASSAYWPGARLMQPRGKNIRIEACMSDDQPAEVPRWFVEVPSTFEAMATQASRSLLSALPHGRRFTVEAAVPELDPTCGSTFRPPELVAFAHDVAEPLISRAGLPASKPHVKLLFSNAADATLAGASILTTSLPVSVLGHSSAVGPRDGAFVVVAPTLADRQIDTDRALADLLQVAGGRLVVLINPRMGNSPLLNHFLPAYFMRPLLSLIHI